MIGNIVSHYRAICEAGSEAAFLPGCSTVDVQLVSQLRLSCWQIAAEMLAWFEQGKDRGSGALEANSIDLRVNAGMLDG
jgi:hypothetical protein